jgi:transcriptional regulator with XRE-family HTH domain
MFLGEAIRSRRLALGLSQEELARRADVSTRTIARLEALQTTPQRATLNRIAAALEVDMSFFALWNPRIRWNRPARQFRQKAAA